MRSERLHKDQDKNFSQLLSTQDHVGPTHKSYCVEQKPLSDHIFQKKQEMGISYPILAKV